MNRAWIGWAWQVGQAAARFAEERSVAAWQVRLGAVGVVGCGMVVFGLAGKLG